MVFDTLMKTLISLFCILTFFLMACVPQQEVLTTNPYLVGEGRPWVLAHGGAKDLFPENTLVAFDGSMALEVDALEIDVCMTADEVLVTHHDLTIDATSDGVGEVISYTFDELQDFNFGYDFTDLEGNQPYQDSPVRIPGLETVFLRYDNVHFVVEIKNRGENGKRAAELMYDLIRSTGVEGRVVVASFSQEILNHFIEVSNGEIPISAAEEEVKDFVFSGLSGMEFLYGPEAVMFQIPRSSAGIPLDAKRLIKSAHRRRMAVQYWTIDDPEEMRRLIELGVDGLITDRPDLMWEVLRDMGY